MDAPQLQDRDMTWVLAIGHAIGLNSGFSIPIVPTVEVFKELFEAIRADERAKAEQQEPWITVAIDDRTGRWTERSDIELEMCKGRGTVKLFTRPPIQSELEQELRAEIAKLKNAVSVKIDNANQLTFER